MIVTMEPVKPPKSQWKPANRFQADTGVSDEIQVFVEHLRNDLSMNNAEIIRRALAALKDKFDRGELKG